MGSRVTGFQTGLILAYLSSRVLGQYELFLPPETSPVDGEQPGRLTLVAPNIVMVERELGVDTHDFRRWVCLHEETHRLQFTAVPWLRDYVQGQMTEFLLASELDPGAILQRIRVARPTRWRGAVRGERRRQPDRRRGRPRAQRAILDRLTSVMTLVEGHGDYVMDAVGPQVVPSVAQIRERFNSAARSSGRIEQTIRRILGIDLKMKQYAEGSRFVTRRGGRGRHGRLQQGLDVAGDAAQPGGVRRTRTSGWSGSHRRLAAIACQPVCGPGVAVAEVRAAVRAGLADLAAGELVLVACSGGADSLALAAATAFAAPRRACEPARVTVDHGLQPGSAERAAEVAALLGGLGLDPVRSAAVTVPRAGRAAGARRPRPGRPGTPRSTRPPRSTAPPRCCSATPSTTRPRPCCSGWPAGPAAGRWPGCPRGGARTAAAAGRAPRRHRRRVRRAGPRAVAGPAQRRSPASPGPGCGTR